MTIRECIAQIEKIDLEIAKSKGFDRWGLHVLKSNWTNHLIKLIKENKYFENKLVVNQKNTLSNPELLNEQYIQ